jgi:AcrR family transcriptional regulator
MKPDKRQDLLDRLTDHVLAHGMGDTGLRTLGKAIGTSDRMLLYYFPDKAALMTGLMHNVAARLAVELGVLAAAPPQPATVLARELTTLATGEAFWPYMRFWLQTAALAAGGDPVCRSVGEAIGRGFLTWIAGRIDGPIAERDREAATLLQLVEGSILLNAVGLRDIVTTATAPIAD